MTFPAALVLLLAALAMPAAASSAEVVFPPGSRIGLAPPADMDLSSRFTGFENRTRSAVITAIEMPADAFRDMTAGLSEEGLKTQGLTVRSRETFKVGDREAILVEGDQSGPAPVRKWLLLVADPTVTAFVIGQKLTSGQEDGGEEMKEALKSVAIREPRGIDEQLEALPFRLGEMGGFRAVRVMAGNSVLLTEGPDDIVREVEQPVLVVARSTSVPPREQREAFARTALRSNSALKDITIERSQSFRQRGADWHEIVAKATDAASGRPVVVSQALRFAPDHYVRVLGMVRADAREAMLARFRAVSDAIEPKER